MSQPTANERTWPHAGGMDEHGNVRCRHGTIVPRLVSKTPGSAGKPFYSCKQPRGHPDNCKFFKWESEFTGEQPHAAPPASSSQKSNPPRTPDNSQPRLGYPPSAGASSPVRNGATSANRGVHSSPAQSQETAQESKERRMRAIKEGLAAAGNSSSQSQSSSSQPTSSPQSRRVVKPEPVDDDLEDGEEGEGSPPASSLPRTPNRRNTRVSATGLITPQNSANAAAGPSRLPARPESPTPQRRNPAARSLKRKASLSSGEYRQSLDVMQDMLDDYAKLEERLSTSEEENRSLEDKIKDLEKEIERLKKKNAALTDALACDTN